MAKNGNIHPTRIFKKPEELEKVWIKYKESLKKEAENWPIITYSGREGERRVDYPVLPYILDGFYTYCRYNKIGTINQYFKNKDKLYNDFVPICRAIKEEIRAQQITGGMLNKFNPSITQRLNGLTEKTETNATLDLSRVPEWMKKKDS